jgi:hypothetical protein
LTHELYNNTIYLVTLLALLLALVTIFFIPTGLEAQKSVDKRTPLEKTRAFLATDSSSWSYGLYYFLPASLGVVAIGIRAVYEQLDDVYRPWYYLYTGNATLVFFASSFVVLLLVCDDIR